MKLSDKQIRDITFGALEIFTDSDGIYRFKRMTDTQAEEFSRESDDFTPKTVATSCVRLDFYTDSDFVDFKFAGLECGSSRKFYSFDMYVNGNLRTSFRQDSYDIKEGNLYAKLESGEKRIQIYLPSLAKGGVEYVEIADGATLTPAKPKMRMLMLGDSITQGYDAKFTSLTYANVTARMLDAEAVNQAIGGAMFYEQQLEYTGKYDIVTVAYGTNDWSKKESREIFTNDCDAYFKKLSELYPDAKKFAILPIYRGNLTRKPTGNFYECRRIVGECAKKHGIIPLESIDYVSHDKIYFADKNLHPNDLGFATYAQKLVEDLKKYL